MDGMNQQMDPDCAFLNTVDDKKSSYTVKAYKQAVLAHRLHEMIGPPSLSDYLYIINNNLLQNCPVTHEDIAAAEDIFGPSLKCLKGKTNRKGTPVWIRPPPSYHRKYIAGFST